VVALGEPGVPVVCCANVGAHVSTINVVAENNSAGIFMIISVGAAVHPERRYGRSCRSRYRISETSTS
jgi:hypothetical protein